MHQTIDTPIAGTRLIDIERVFAEKNPRLLKLMPGFIIRYLKRVIHQDKLNNALELYKGLQGLDFIEKILEELGVKITVEGLKNLTVDGRYIIIANHPLGGLDGMALMKVVGSVRKDILFPVNDLLMYLPNLKPLFIPLNKHGRNVDNIRLFDEAFASDAAILYFPAGLCSRKLKGNIIDLEWKKTFIAKAKKFKRDIVPVHIKGSNSNFFYNLARWRVKLGLKTNIEMLYLVDEMFKQKDKEILLKFGKPVPYQFFDGSKRDNEWAAYMKEHVYSLSETSALNHE
ncbi:MAG: 1-acyl-sn-glycerol-3-phosphate acyltransferase [Bacteroidales bacterium]|nr:1-acyl-sn-glycerol-3-phosphate acyltransferase [Bacteroidales bacterium]